MCTGKLTYKDDYGRGELDSKVSFREIDCWMYGLEIMLMLEDYHPKNCWKSHFKPLSESVGLRTLISITHNIKYK